MWLVSKKSLRFQLCIGESERSGWNDRLLHATLKLSLEKMRDGRWVHDKIVWFRDADDDGVK